jgi:hypothetical protein
VIASETNKMIRTHLRGREAGFRQRQMLPRSKMLMDTEADTNTRIRRKLPTATLAASMRGIMAVTRRGCREQAISLRTQVNECYGDYHQRSMENDEYGTLLDGGHMHPLRAIILTGVILSAAYAAGQDTNSPKPNAANGGDATYSNECLALTYRLPDGWEFAKSNQGRASNPNTQMRLFKVQRHSAAGSAESLSVDVLKTPLQHPNMERFTILLALSFVHLDSSKNKITRNAYPVTIAGRSFFRSDAVDPADVAGING